MSKFLSAGGLTGLFSLASALAAAFGYATASSKLADPNMIAIAGTVVTGVAGVVAGFLPNHKAA